MIEKMAESGVHYLALSDVKDRLAKNEEEYAVVSIQLNEALKMGDLRENSEYDTAKEAVARVVEERDMLTPVLSLPVVKANDSASIIEEGCVLDIQVYKPMPSPIKDNSEELNRLIRSSSPVFTGRVMFGGTLPIHELLVDSALSVDTPVGAYLLGKRPGSFCVQVPGGFVPVTAKKLRSNEFQREEIRCEFYG